PETNHGTHVAGIAGAAQNGIGMHGVAFEADLAFYTYGSGALSQAAAFNAAAAQGAVAINNSYGINTLFSDVRNRAAFATDPYQALAEELGLTAAHWRAEAQAMQNAQQQGVIVWAVANTNSGLNDIDISAGMPLILPD